MSAYIESLILYAVLFLRYPASPLPPEESITFSAVGELARIVVYNIPSLALIWHLLFKVKGPGEWGLAWPNRKDLIVTALAFPALLLIGLAISLVSPYFEGIPAGPAFLPPADIASWIILVLSCVSAAYLEESFFRFYILSKQQELGLGPLRAALISTLLFSFCHVYEGPWGFLNAALAGAVLALIFLRSRSLHGIAFAHALYNILTYILALAENPV